MKSFSDLYQEIYQNSAQELSAIKKEKRVKHILLFAGIVISFLLWKNMPILFTLMIAIFAIWLLISYSKQRAVYTSYYKEVVIKKFVKSYADTLEYFPHQGIERGLYNEANFEGYYDRYHSDDLVKGTILENYPIMMGEVHTEREETTTDSDGHTTTTYVTLFHGIFSAVELPKKIQFQLNIRKNALLSDVFKGKNKLDMDSSDFEKIFDVNTTDKIQAMRILTSDVMQKLIDFKNENKITPEITIQANTLYIRYATGAVFEPNVIRNDMDFDKLKKYYDIICFTMGLAEEFAKNMAEFDE